MAARGRAGPFSCLSPFPFLCQRLLGTSFPGEHHFPSSLSPAPQEVPWILLWSLFQVLDTIPSDLHNYNNQHLLSSYCLPDCDAQDVCILGFCHLPFLFPGNQGHCVSSFHRRPPTPGTCSQNRAHPSTCLLVTLSCLKETPSQGGTASVSVTSKWGSPALRPATP